MPLPFHPRLAALALAGVVLLVLGFGCGGDSGDDGPSVDGGSSGTASEVRGGSDERQVRQVVEGLYDDLARYDAEAVCQRMSPAARKQIAQGAVGGSAESGSCADSFGKFLATAKENGGLKRTLTAKVGEVEIDGDEALVTVSFGRQSGQVPLSKVRGEWKMGIVVATPSTEPPASDAQP